MYLASMVSIRTLSIWFDPTGMGIHMFVSRLAIFICLGLMLTTGSSNAQSQLSSGKNIATQLCATCHLVADDQTAAMADVPTFRSIAGKYGEEMDYLVGFLAEPHPPMPNFNLTRREIFDLLAYIKSLR